jgi:hypothetical protein
MMTSIKAFAFNNLQQNDRYFALYSYGAFFVKVGFYGDDGVLTDVTADTIVNILQQPHANDIKTLTYVIPGNGSTVFSFYVSEAGSYLLEFVYQGNSCLLGMCAVNKNRLPVQNEIYAQIKRKEPQLVYTQDRISSSPEYVDCTAISSVFGVLYTDLQAFYDQLIPSGGNAQWEFLLNGTNGLIETNNNFDVLMRQLYTLKTNNSCNRYDVSFFLSRFILTLTGSMNVWVYMQEVNITNFQNWILGSSRLGQNTYLGATVLNPTTVTIYVIPVTGTWTPPTEVAQEIYNVARKMVPFYFDLVVDYSATLASLGLTQFLNQTYSTDTRHFNVEYAINYLPFGVEQAQGVINPDSIGNLDHIVITPVDGTIFTVGTFQNYTITGFYKDGDTVDLTFLATKSLSDYSKMVISSDQLIPLAPTSSIVFTANYGYISAHVTYSIVPPAVWILDTSQLDTTTILG